MSRSTRHEAPAGTLSGTFALVQKGFSLYSQVLTLAVYLVIGLLSKKLKILKKGTSVCWKQPPNAALLMDGKLDMQEVKHDNARCQQQIAPIAPQSLKNLCGWGIGHDDSAFVHGNIANVTLSQFGMNLVCAKAQSANGLSSPRSGAALQVNAEGDNH